MTSQKRPHLDYRLHALDGMPQCAHCKKTYTTWKGFQYHIAMGCEAMRTLNRGAALADDGLPAAVMTRLDLLALHGLGQTPSGHGHGGLGPAEGR